MLSDPPRQAAMVREHSEVTAQRQGTVEMSGEFIGHSAARNKNKCLSHAICISTGQSLPDSPLRLLEETRGGNDFQMTTQARCRHRRAKRKPVGVRRGAEYVDLPESRDLNRDRIGSQQTTRELLRRAHGGAADRMARIVWALIIKIEYLPIASACRLSDRHADDDGM